MLEEELEISRSSAACLFRGLVSGTFLDVCNPTKSHGHFISTTGNRKEGWSGYGVIANATPQPVGVHVELPPVNVVP